MAGRLAAFVSPGRSLANAVERVRLCERLGYETVFTTHIASRDGLMTLAAYGAATSTIKLGVGVLPALPRQPVSLAMEAATLDEMIGGRLVLGIGPSHAITMDMWYGMPLDKPLSRMREYVQILRSIFTTGGVAFQGEFYRAQFGFMGYAARKDLPIYIAALAPNMLRFAGEATDGVVLWACMPSYIEKVVVPLVREGAERAGRDPASIEIVAAVPCAVTDNVGAARDAFRGEFFTYMNLPFYRRAIEGAGFGDEIAAFDAALGKGDMPGALAAMSDRMLDHFCGFGDEAVVRAKLEEYRAAGATLPAVGVGDLSSDGFAGADATLEAAVR